MFLTAFPEASVEVSESKLVFARLPDVVHCVGQLPLSDLGQLLSPGWRQCAIEGVLSGTLCVTSREDKSEGNILGICSAPVYTLSVMDNDNGAGGPGVTLRRWEEGQSPAPQSSLDTLHRVKHYHMQTTFFKPIQAFS